nr:MAG TPA: hypothetical protein [Caudoviricetes sp.]
MLHNLNSDGSIKYDPNLVINFNDPHNIGYEDCIRYLAAHVVKNKSDGDVDQIKIAVELMSNESFVEWKAIAAYVAKSTLKRKYYPLNIQIMLYLVATERIAFADLLAEKLLEVDVASIKNSYRVRKYRHKKAVTENLESMYKLSQLKKEHAAIENKLEETINQLKLELKQVRSEHKTIEANFIMELNRKGGPGVGESIPEVKTDFAKSAGATDTVVTDTHTPADTLGIGGLPAFAKDNGIITGAVGGNAGAVDSDVGGNAGVSGNEEMSAGEMFRKTVSEAAKPMYGAIAVNGDGDAEEGEGEVMGGDA